MGEADVDGALIVQPINHKFEHSLVTRSDNMYIMSTLDVHFKILPLQFSLLLFFLCKKILDFERLQSK